MPKDEGEVHRDGDGFPGIEKIMNWRTSMKWAKTGLVISMYNGKCLKELEEWSDFGVPIFAPSCAAAELEIKREEGMKLLERCGIEVPSFETFKTLEKASAFAWKTDKPWVFKTLGNEEDKALSFVASDPAQLAGWIDRQIEKGMKLKGPCMLQERVDGIEMGVSGWFGAAGFLKDKWNINFEHKKMMSSDYGPNTGEMGTLMQYVAKEKMATDILMPLEKELLKLNHRGDFAVNCIIDKKGKAWPLEFTVRMGYPALLIMMQCHRGDPVQWMKDALSGHDTLKVKTDVAAGVVLAIPPFPGEEDPDEVIGNPIYGVEEVWEQVSPTAMMLGPGADMKNGKVVKQQIYQTSGATLGVVTGLGKTVSKAVDAAFKAIDEIKVSNLMVRDDIGESLEEELPVLHKLGYATSMEYK